MRERFAETAENSSDSAISEVQFALKDCFAYRKWRHCRQWLKPLPEQRMGAEAHRKPIVVSESHWVGKIGSTTSVGNGKCGFCANEVISPSSPVVRKFKVEGCFMSALSSSAAASGSTECRVLSTEKKGNQRNMRQRRRKRRSNYCC